MIATSKHINKNLNAKNIYRTMLTDKHINEHLNTKILIERFKHKKNYRNIETPKIIETFE